MLKRLTAAVLSLTIMFSAFAPAAYAMDETEPQQELQIEEQTDVSADSEENFSDDVYAEENVNEEEDVQSDNQPEEKTQIETMEIVSETVVVDTDLPDNDEIFSAYVEQQFYGSSIAVFGRAGRDRLTETEKAIYDVLKERIEEVAENGGSTQIVISNPETIGLKAKWTNEELGVSSIDNLEIASEQFKAQYNSKKVMEALLHDCPYEMYWFDKTAGMNVSFRQARVGYFEPSIGANVFTEYVVTDFTFTLTVENDYMSGNNTTVTSEVGNVKSAVANANEVAAKYADKTDYEKMLGFKNEICALTDYNYAALNNGVAYGNPWQMIYVFDGDETTKVVCEGYSKAFQYLCDMTGVECYTTTGMMAGGTGAGAHMWNIVPMGNSNYMVDITNSDAGTIGQGGQLFLAGAEGSVESGYIFTIGNTDVKYTYDSDEIAMWGDELLTLASENFNPVPKELGKGTYGENISWIVNDTDYDGKGDVVVISGSGEIADSAEPMPWDAYKADIMEVVVEDGVTSIGFNMFEGYTSLETVKLPQTIKKIGACAFSNTAIREITIPEGVTEIAANTFSGCTNLETVILPETVTAIGTQAFANCTDLESVEVPASVTSIDAEAFIGCTALKSIVYCGSAQYWFDNLSNINLSEKVKVTFKGEQVAYALNENGTGYVLIYWSNAKGKITVADSYNDLPVTEIGEAVFAFNNDITEVVISENVTKIGENAFNSCRNIEVITMPSTMEYIDEDAIAGCNSLKTIVFNGNAQDWYDRYLDTLIPDGVKVDFVGDSIAFAKMYDDQHQEIDEYVLLAWSEASGDIVVPATFRDLPVTEIGVNVFYGNEDITSVEVEEGIEVIQTSAFEGCKNLTTVKLPDSVWGIATNAFADCDNLGYVYYPSSYNWNHNAVKLYGGNEKLADATFICATDWGYKYLRDDFSIIGKENLTENLIIPETINGHTVDIIHSAGDHPVFENGTEIKTVVISQGIKGMQIDAFNGCSNIEEITVPASLNEFYNGHATPFEGVPKTAKIYVAKGNSYAKAGFRQFGFTNVIDDIPVESISTVEELIVFMRSENDILTSCVELPKIVKFPADATREPEIVWSVAEGDLVIETDEKGVQRVYANIYGKGKLVATDINSGASTTVDVTARLPKAERLEARIYPASGEPRGLKFGETARIEILSATAGIIPNDKITFVPDNNVTVDENGVATSVYKGEKPGKAIITATLKTENKSVKVEIPLIVALAGIAAKDVALELGKTAVLPAVTKVPTTAGEDISIEWSVAEGSEEIIELAADESGETVIKAKDIGIAQLVATDTNSSFSTTVNVTVKLPKAEKLVAVWDTAVDKAGLEAGESRTMKISGSTVGELGAKYFDFKSSNEKAVTVDENGVITVVFEGSGTASASATITATVKGDTSKKVSLAVKAIPKQTAGIEIIAEYDNAEIKTVTDENGVQTLIIPRSLVKDGTLPISLKAVAKDADGNEVITNVKWTTDAANIAKVAAVKGTTDSADVTVGKNVDGLAVITATANDLKKATGTIEIDVRDYTPRLEVNTVTLNTFKTSGESVALYTAYDAILRDYNAQMAMLLAEETQVTDVNLSGTGSENFTAVYDSENSTVVFNAADAVKNGTYKLNLNILTAEGETTQVVTVKVANKLPKVTIKQATPFELFLKDSTADITVTATDPANAKAEAAIKAVTMTDCDTFVATAYNTDTDSITVSYLDQDNPISKFVNGKTADTKVNLVVEFEGYRETYIQKNYTVKAKETKVTLGQSRTSTKFSAAVNSNKPINVIDAKTKEVLDLTYCTVTAQSTSADYVTVTKDGENLTITPKLTEGKFNVNGKVATSHAAKIDVQHENWLRPITISHSISISDSKVAPTMKLKAASLKLNSAFDTFAETLIVPSLDNCPQFPWTVTEQPTKTQTAEDFAKLDVKVNGWKVTAAFKDGVPAKGAYKYLITTFIAGKEVKLALTVNVAETLPNVTLAATSAKLNSAIKEDTAVKFKVPAGYEVTGATVTNSKGNVLTAEDISVEYTNGEIAVKVLKSDLAKGNYKYDIVPVVKLAGEEYSTETPLKKVLSLTVNVFNGVPNVTYSAKGKIDLVNRGTGITYTLTKGTNFVYSAADVDTATFALVGTDADKFNIRYLGTDAKGQHMVEVTAKAEAQLKKGGKYSYNIAVDVNGIEEAVTMQKAVTVSPSQSTVKFVTKGSTTIWQSYKGTAYFNIEATTPVEAKIANVVILDTKATTVPNNALDFDVSQRPDGSWKVSYTIKKASKLKVNKTYKLALEVTPEGNGEGVKPQTFTVSFKVKR